MIKLDDELLAEVGLAALPAEERQLFLEYVYETLELRVGTVIARGMTSEQLYEFEVFIETDDEAGAQRFLDAVVPHYKQLVQEQFDLLKQEIKEIAEQILATSSD